MFYPPGSLKNGGDDSENLVLSMSQAGSILRFEYVTITSWSGSSLFGIKLEFGSTWRVISNDAYCVWGVDTPAI